MFSKLTTALILAAPLVNALTINIPQNPQSSGQVTITWTFNVDTDPSTFSLELTNEDFNDSFAIANNVELVTGSITLTLPVVPVGGGYTIEAVNIGNIGQVYAQTGDFSIAANSATTSTASSSAAASTGSSVSGSAASSSTAKATTLSVPATSVSVATTGFGTTVTAPVSQSSSTGSVAGTSASSASSASASTFNSNGAVGSFNFAGNMGMIAAAVLSAVAGAAVVAL